MHDVYAYMHRQNVLEQLGTYYVYTIIYMFICTIITTLNIFIY
jgi:hypothetical protein